MHFTRYISLSTLITAALVVAEQEHASPKSRMVRKRKPSPLLEEFNLTSEDTSGGDGLSGVTKALGTRPLSQFEQAGHVIGNGSPLQDLQVSGPDSLSNNDILHLIPGSDGTNLDSILPLDTSSIASLTSGNLIPSTVDAVKNLGSAGNLLNARRPQLDSLLPDLGGAGGLGVDSIHLAASTISSPGAGDLVGDLRGTLGGLEAAGNLLNVRQSEMDALLDDLTDAELNALLPDFNDVGLGSSLLGRLRGRKVKRAMASFYTPSRGTTRYHQSGPYSAMNINEPGIYGYGSPFQQAAARTGRLFGGLHPHFPY